MRHFILFLLFFAFASLFAQESTNDDKQSLTNVQLIKDGGQILVYTTPSNGKGESDIQLINLNANGEEVWRKTYGGSSYERVGAIQETRDGGFVIVGSTSSFGAGNYDIYLIKTDAKGEQEWTRTFGGFYNEYGYSVRQSKEDGFLIGGKKQVCNSHNDWSNCYDTVWLIKTDSQGKELWSKALGAEKI